MFRTFAAMWLRELGFAARRAFDVPSLGVLGLVSAGGDLGAVSPFGSRNPPLLPVRTTRLGGWTTTEYHGKMTSKAAQFA
jgi:hypothetical protein